MTSEDYSHKSTMSKISMAQSLISSFTHCLSRSDVLLPLLILIRADFGVCCWGGAFSWQDYSGAPFCTLMFVNLLPFGSSYG